MSQQILLLDLDRTLFDTQAFINRIISDVLPKISGASPERVADLFRQQQAGSGTLLYELDYGSIFTQLGITFLDFRRAAQELVLADEFVYDDAKSLLTWLQDSPYSAHTNILSFGSKDMQSFKVALSPSLSLLPLHTTLTYKRDYIAKQFHGKQGYLVDDKPDQQLPAGWHEIHINRKVREYRAPLHVAKGITQICALTDVPKILA